MPRFRKIGARATKISSAMRHTFGKSEKLKSEKIISQIFRGGNSYVAYPLRVVWIVQDLTTFQKLPNPTTPKPEIKIGVSVPKKVFKTAVSRNRIKRLIREAWRLNKHLFLEKTSPGNFNLNMMLVYVAKEELPFSEVEKGVRKAAKKLEIQPNNDGP